MLPCVLHQYNASPGRDASYLDYIWERYLPYIVTEVCSNELYIKKATYTIRVFLVSYYYGSFLCTEFPIQCYIIWYFSFMLQTP